MRNLRLDGAAPAVYEKDTMMPVVARMSAATSGTGVPAYRSRPTFHAGRSLMRAT